MREHLNRFLEAIKSSKERIEMFVGKEYQQLYK